jgi:hypothetical protein
VPNFPELVIRYQDLNSTEYSRLVVDTAIPRPENNFLAFLYKVHQSKRINKIVNLPLKHIWKNLTIFFKKEEIFFNRPNPYCFVIYGRFFDFLQEHRNIFIQRLRAEYKNCKIILYLADILKSYSFDIAMYMDNFDVIYSFDKGEAFNNNFSYYEEQPFSFYNVRKNKSLPPSDVVFVGRAKTRFNEIIQIFELLEENGLTCDFHIIDVPKAEQKYTDKIKYPNYVDYYKLLQHVISSKCILEILQDDGISPTARVSEAILYEKKLLSNCQDLKTKPYYNPKYISLFSSWQNIDIDFLKKNIESIDYKYKENLSPLRFIERIEKYLLVK